MHRLGIIVFAVLLSWLLSSCQSTDLAASAPPEEAPKEFVSALDNSELSIPKHGRMHVRTTAYTHSEADSLIYGKKTATGTTLRYGSIRSVAADWSRFPLGTIFKIEGDPHVYQVDDYGSALLGTNTIDMYKPTRSAMNQWGVRFVDIQVIKWGSYERSLAILDDRRRWRHCRMMADDIAMVIARSERG